MSSATFSRMDNISEHLTLWSSTYHSLFLSKNPWKFCSLSPLNWRAPTILLPVALLLSHFAPHTGQRLSAKHSQWMALRAQHTTLLLETGVSLQIADLWARWITLLCIPLGDCLGRAPLCSYEHDGEFVTRDTHYCCWGLWCSMGKNCCEDWICSLTGRETDQTNGSVKPRVRQWGLLCLAGRRAPRPPGSTPRCPAVSTPSSGVAVGQELFGESGAQTQKTQNPAGLEEKSSAENRREKAKRYVLLCTCFRMCIPRFQYHSHCC